MTIFESLHQDDMKKIGVAIKNDCAKCRQNLLERCTHEISVSEINQTAVDARRYAETQESINGRQEI